MVGGDSGTGYVYKEFSEHINAIWLKYSNYNYTKPEVPKPSNFSFYLAECISRLHVFLKA